MFPFFNILGNNLPQQKKAQIDLQINNIFKEFFASSSLIPGIYINTIYDMFCSEVYTKEEKEEYKNLISDLSNEGIDALIRMDIIFLFIHLILRESVNKYLNKSERKYFKDKLIAETQNFLSNGMDGSKDKFYKKFLQVFEEFNNEYNKYPISKAENTKKLEDYGLLFNFQIRVGQYFLMGTEMNTRECMPLIDKLIKKIEDYMKSVKFLNTN